MTHAKLVKELTSWSKIYQKVLFKKNYKFKNLYDQFENLRMIG